MSSPVPKRWALWLSLLVAGMGRVVPAPAADPDAETARLEARVRQLEAQVEALSDQLGARTEPPGTSAPGTIETATGDGERTPVVLPLPPSGPSTRGGLKARYGAGFVFETADTEFTLQFRDLTQIDGRFFTQGGQDPVHDTFGIPAQWFIFSGRLTRPYEYYLSIAQGFNALVILDIFLNIRYDDRMQVRLGRFFVPFTYELYALPLDALITPERSIFFNNFANNRDVGLMAWGQLARRRFDYAAGVFNGIRNGFVDTNDAKDFVGYFNVRPFAESRIAALNGLNLGGSTDVGIEDNPPSPQTLRTIVPAPGNAIVGVPFLSFFDGVRETGRRALGSLHLAYYYRQLSVVAEWEGGFEEYASGPGTSRTRLPIRSGYVQAGYFLTGETVGARGQINPRRPFDLRRGRRGWGAWEVQARYNPFAIGANVFTAGLADPNLWTDRLYTTDVGLNWCWNQYLKVAFTWQHAEFARPVLERPNARQLTSDLFLLRFQIRF